LEKLFAEVYVELKHRRLDRIFHYGIPPGLTDRIKVGARVVVPFGNKLHQGYVVNLVKRADVEKIKNIKELLDERPLFTPQDIELARWMADYYLCPFVAALECILPAGLKYENSTVIALLGSDEEAMSLLNSLKFMDTEAAEVLQFVLDKSSITRANLEKKFSGKNVARAIETLVDYGVISMKQQFRMTGFRREMSAILVRDEEISSDTQALANRAPKQGQLLSTLMDKKRLPVSLLLKQTGAPKSSLNALVAKGLVRLEEDTVAGKVIRQSDRPEVIHELTDKQEQVFRRVSSAIRDGKYAPFLLHGVTGSGKTEVYLRAVQRALEEGKSAVVLVPEIALASQMVSRFSQRFGEGIAVIHSGLSRAERLQEWMRVHRGQAKVVLGARSAVFAPVKDIGIIIIDEEHESSYKQDQVPKYHAREVAKARARQHEAALVLGSATPALESYLETQKRNYGLLTIDQRVTTRPLPVVAVVDMRQERRQGNSGIFSTALFQSLENCLGNGEQAILFLNRRGFASFLICDKCGFSIRCPHCDIALTHHTKGNKLMCHYCGYQQQVVTQCPRCGSPGIGGVGCGTQQVEEEMYRRFPDLSVIRMDVDNTRKQGAHQRLLDKFGSGEGSVLIGTQMVAKGLDFPNVTLVGVISADTGINLPDFRAWERTFQLLTQVAGRAGRGQRPGRVVVQTYQPDNPAVGRARTHDYLGFYRSELARRRQFGYPPFCRLIRVLITGQDEVKVKTGAEALSKVIKKNFLLHSAAGEILGPAPAPLAKIKGKHRWHLVAKSPDAEELKGVVSASLRQYSLEFDQQGTNLAVDVDPSGMI